MRNAFADELLQLALGDDRVVLLSGDIGNRLFDKFKAATTNRFYNLGVAEANLMGMAAGLALNGLRPIAYTITPFITTRCLEQIRVDVCYHEAPVLIVGVGSGLSYASLGATHHSCEDIAFLRALPNMTVVCPADSVELRCAMRAALQHPGPLYIRMGKKGEPDVHASTPNFALGKGIELRAGTRACLLGTGTIMPVVLAAAQLLEAADVSTRVVSMHTVKPLDEVLLTEVFASFAVVTTVEEHSLIGGFGSAVAEWKADQQGSLAPLCRLGTFDEFFHEVGEQDRARAHFGLTAQNICDRTLQRLVPTGSTSRLC